jgi:thymidylate synthase (FAD)
MTSMTERTTQHPGAVERKKPQEPFVDVMGGDLRWEIAVLDQGFIALLDVMPRLVPQGQTADQAIVQAARVSYGEGTKRISEDRSLLRYLLRHRHTTPFEMVEFKFHVRLPIFVARQWIRHRTASVNEYSGRYSIMPERFYRPQADEVREQSASNRQGGEETIAIETAEAFLEYLAQAEAQHERYLALSEKGVARELARLGLPLSMYTEWYWKCDLHNVLHFLSLRLDEHAQREIRAYAEAMLRLIEPIVPQSVEAFRDYRLRAVSLTRLEVEAIRSGADIDTSNKRERAEFEEKKRKLGL